MVGRFFLNWLEVLLLMGGCIGIIFGVVWVVEWLLDTCRPWVAGLLLTLVITGGLAAVITASGL